MTLTIKNNEINSNEILESACAKLLAYDINGSIIKRKNIPILNQSKVTSTEMENLDYEQQ